ncbi:hypothetical protein AAZX31_07G152800 [Glycine max]
MSLQSQVTHNKLENLPNFFLPKANNRRGKNHVYLVSKSTRFISLTLADTSAIACMIKSCTSSGNSISGVMFAYHIFITKSFNIKSTKSFKAASTIGESIFFFHLGGGGE